MKFNSAHHFTLGKTSRQYGCIIHLDYDTCENKEASLNRENAFDLVFIKYLAFLAYTIIS